MDVDFSELSTMMRDEAEKAIIDEVVTECRKAGITSIDDVAINLNHQMRSLGVRMHLIKQQISRRIA